eukprot:gene12281-15430_t
MEKVLERGEKIKLMADKADELQTQNRQTVIARLIQRLPLLPNGLRLLYYTCRTAKLSTLHLYCACHFCALACACSTTPAEPPSCQR